MSFVQYIAERLAEPSSVAGLSIIITGIASTAGGDYLTGIPAIIGGLGALFIPETGVKH